MPQDLASSYAYCDTLLREEDRDWWLALLFAPAAVRPQLHALGAFFTEIGRVRDRVRQPLAGEIRLQWWRDVLEGEARGDAHAHPVAAALLDTIARHDLSRGTLIDALEAHRIALYGEAPQTVAEFERFFDRTVGAGLRCETRVLGGGSNVTDEAVRHVAVAIGIANLLRHLGHYVTRGFGIAPHDILARHGLSQDDVAAVRAGDPSPALRAVLVDLRALARDHLARLQDETCHIPGSAAPAFLLASLVEPTLRLSERSRTPLTGELALPQWRRQWILWRAARNGGSFRRRVP